MRVGVTTALIRNVGLSVSALALLMPATAHPDDLRDFVSKLYGGDGIQTDFEQGQAFGGDFESSSTETLANLGGVIGSSLSSISASGGGSSFTFDLELGVLVETSEGFGPLVAERADTIGARRLSLAFSYTRIDFKRFNGDSLTDLSFTAQSQDINGDGMLGQATGVLPDAEEALELDKVRVDLKLDIERDVFAIFGRYGISEFWDVELLVPVNRIRARARAEATVVCNDFSAGTVLLCENFHKFSETGGEGDLKSSSLGGTKLGIGDVVLRTKWHFLRDHNLWPEMALLGQLKLPTGDKKNFMGTGETDFQVMIIASKTWWRFTPHVNLAYELTSGPEELDNLRYVVGVEANAHKRLTVAVDVVGRLAPHADPRSDHIVDIAVGARVSLWRTLLLNANVQVPLNRNTGLRPDFIWTVGIQYGFGG